VSLIGSAVSFVALPLVALFALHANAFQMGVLTAVERLPPLLLGPLAGPLADRRSRWRLMLVADAARAVLLAWIPLGVLFGVLAFWQLVVIAFAVGAFSLLFNVAYQAFLPNLIPAQQLTEGNGKLSASQSAAEVTGPGLASLLMAAAGPALGVLADAVSYAVSALCLLRLRTRDAVRPAPDRATFWQDIRSGLPLLRRDRVLLTVTASNAVLAFFAQLQAAVYFVFLVRTLHLGAGLIGVLFLIAGGIGFGTALVCDRLAARIGLGALVVTGQVVMVAGGTLLAAAGGHIVARAGLIIAGEACFGAGMSLFGVGYSTLFQVRTADEVRGRVIGTSRFLTSSLVPAGAVLGGVLGVVFSVRLAMIVGAAGMACGLVLVLRRRVLHATGAVERPAPG
jgi:MFS family permease